MGYSPWGHKELERTQHLHNNINCLCKMVSKCGVFLMSTEEPPLLILVTPRIEETCLWQFTQSKAYFKYPGKNYIKCS